MKWKKIGLFLDNVKLGDWHNSHYSVPVGENLDNEFLKVYLSGRDSKNRSYTSYVVLDIEKNFDLVEISEKPVLSPGKNGEFDDSGTMATWIFNTDDTSYLYYIGWNIGNNVPFRNSIGLATKAIKEKEFNKISNGPILDRSVFDPAFVASCCVLKVENEYFMWYLSSLGWYEKDKVLKSKYNIKLAKSYDLLNWSREGVTCIDFENKEEYAISRPSVIYEDGIFKMWYSVKGENYKIGYAESSDGVIWNRHDNLVGIKTSNKGWDSEMIEYPHVLKIKSQKFMLFNGNNYGENGFGIAYYDE